MAHAVLERIRFKTCGYVNPKLEQQQVANYRFFDPDVHKRCKRDHVKEIMFEHLVDRQ